MNQGNDLPNHYEDRAQQGSGLYVDVENLHPNGQGMIQSLVKDWPAKAPALSHLTLYVRADQVELWRLWATNHFRDLELSVKGTQHFSLSASKNSADIAIATNAMTDLILGRITYVVVFSDDSDFISLYVAIRDEPDVPLVDGGTPFLWIVNDREGPLSTTVKQFFPLTHLHVVTTGGGSGQVGVAKSPAPVSGDSVGDPWTNMAEHILREIPVGPFKSTDCQAVIRKHWPQHPMARASGASFGTEFKNNIWPVLKLSGVTISDPGVKPIRYEMTAQAKTSIH